MVPLAVPHCHAKSVSEEYSIYRKKLPNGRRDFAVTASGIRQKGAFEYLENRVHNRYASADYDKSLRLNL